MTTKLNGVEQLWTKVGVMEHDVHRLKSDMTEVVDGMKTLLQRDASRPKQLEIENIFRTGVAMFAFAAFLIGVVQWQIQASTRVDQLRLSILERQVESLHGYSGGMRHKRTSLDLK